MIRAILLLALIVFVMSLECICKVSGEKSREEEKDEVLKKDSNRRN